MLQKIFASSYKRKIDFLIQSFYYKMSCYTLKKISSGQRARNKCRDFRVQKNVLSENKNYNLPSI